MPPLAKTSKSEPLEVSSRSLRGDFSCQFGDAERNGEQRKKKHSSRILSHKTHLNKLKIIEIIQCLLQNHNEIWLEINKRKITGKS